MKLSDLHTNRFPLVPACAFLIFTFSGCKKETPVEQPPPDPNPVARIVSPTSSTILQDSVYVQVEATDDKGVVKVEVYIDNEVPQGGVLLHPPYFYLWNLTSYPDSSVHTLYAKAYDADGNVSSTPVMTLTVFKFAPSNLSAVVVSDTLIRLAWRDNSRKETGYEVERKLNDSVFVLVKSLPANMTSADIEGVYKVNDKISFRVRAVASEDKSKYSNVATVGLTFPAPQLSGVSLPSDTLAKLTWIDNSSFETGFEIELSKNTKPFVKVGEIQDNRLTATISDTFYVGQPYTFRIRAKSRYNVSEYSNTLVANLSLPPPSNLSLTSISLGEVKLQWQDNSSYEKGFAIERQAGTSSFNEVYRASSNVTSWNDNFLDTTQNYAYRIRAFSEFNKSDYSQPLRWTYVREYTLSKSLDHYMVTSVAISPDGRALATGGGDKTIKLWQLSDGKLLGILTGHLTSVFSVAFSRNGSMLASGGSDGSVNLWNISDGTLIGKFSSNSIAVFSVAFNQEGTILGSGHGDYSVRLWKVGDGTLLRTLAGHTNQVQSVSFSSDGMLIASASMDKTIRIWRNSDGLMLQLLTGHSGWVYSVCFSPDGSLIASGSMDYTVRLWQSSDGRPIRTLTANTRVFSVGISHDGTSVAGGGEDRTIRIWKISDGTLAQTLTGHQNDVTSVAFSPVGSRLVSGSIDGSAKIWDIRGSWRSIP